MTIIQELHPRSSAFDKVFKSVLLTLLLISSFNQLHGAQAEENSNPKPAVKVQEFKADKLGDGRGWDNTILGFSVLRNDAGMKVAILKGTFSSPEAATRQIADDLRHPPDVLEQGQARDHSGNVVGERVVVTWKIPVTHEKYVAIVWNNGCKYHRVASPSLLVAKTFEQSIKDDDEKEMLASPKKQN